MEMTWGSNDNNNDDDDDDDDELTWGSGTASGVDSVVIAREELLTLQPADVHAYNQPPTV